MTFIKKNLKRLDIIASGLVMVTLAVVTIWSVVARFILNSPLAWADGISKYALVCITMLGSSYVLRTGDHIRMTEFLEKLPHAIQIWAQCAINCIATCFFALITWCNIALVADNLGTIVLSTGMPYWLFYLPCIIGYGLVTVFYALRAAEDIRRNCAEMRADGKGE